MRNWIAETVRRVMQVLTGIFIFDLPLISFPRKAVIKYLICYKRNMGKGNVFSSKINFYVPHGMKIGKVTIGNDVRISKNVAIDCSCNNLRIEDNVWISENVTILTHEHIINGKNRKESKNVQAQKELLLGEDSWIGANAIILPQVSRIGQGAIIGAGSVVTQNVEPYTVMAGNPAKRLRER